MAPVPWKLAAAAVICLFFAMTSYSAAGRSAESIATYGNPGGLGHPANLQAWGMGFGFVGTVLLAAAGYVWHARLIGEEVARQLNARPPTPAQPKQ